MEAGLDLDLDDAWEQYCQGGVSVQARRNDVPTEGVGVAPDPTPIYISTKTKIGFLDRGVNLNDAFWGLPIVPYHAQREGVIKKQMKFNSRSPSELEDLSARAAKAALSDPLEEHVMDTISNPGGRIAFRDVRKLSFGLSRRDILSDRRRRRGAFYNCFVAIVRVLYEDRYREIHVKVFNTGKLEVPGIQHDDLLDRTLAVLTRSLRAAEPARPPPAYDPSRSETVLINSNFNCGFYIDRSALQKRLGANYLIHSTYDPCSYPGIQCAFYYDPRLQEQTGRQPLDPAPDVTKVSFMVFRTGSVLIVGKCTEEILMAVYAFLTSLLRTEYRHVVAPNPCAPAAAAPDARRRPKRRFITVTPGPASR